MAPNTKSSTVETEVEPVISRGGATLSDYIKIARPDHWTKNLFILPGLFLGKMVSHAPLQSLLVPLILGMAATCLISSANYTINEWLDRHFDRFHPKKRSRPSVSGRLSGTGVYLEYALLIIGGMALSWLVNPGFTIASLVLLVMGFLYNVKPFRTKDRVYMDVLSESVNNPIRLCMGWLIAVPHSVPPSSILLGYWFGGAFLMAVKRLAEFRTIGDQTVAGLYRQSFKRYNEKSLLASSVFYAMAASLFLGVFLVKYRIELILSFPLIAGLFSWYIRMGLDEDSAAQHPEKLLRERSLMLYVVLLTVVMAVLFIFDIPILHSLLKITFPEL
ncbi:MAG: UbiA prenyltransferase family protein [Verrucomicrobiota bacterium]